MEEHGQLQADDMHQHAHDHEHGHGHHHDHEHHHHHHDHAEGAAPDRSQALLSYMVGHNKSHAEEMRQAAAGMEGEAQALVIEAAELLDAGNAKLEQALALLKGAQEE